MGLPPTVRGARRLRVGEVGIGRTARSIAARITVEDDPAAIDLAREPSTVTKIPEPSF
jgi:hypothetical protein